jgi:RNA polymerase-binding transcription factor DksA
MATSKSKSAPKKKVAPKAPSRPAAKTAKKAAAKSPAKKAVAKPAAKPAAKAVAKPAAKAAKPAAKRAAKAAKPAPAKKSAAKPAPRPAPEPAAKPAAPAPSKAHKPPRPFKPEELASFRAMLEQQLELVQGNINALAGDNLKLSPMDSTGDISSHSTHMADHGTDNFDRELALSLASTRQDSVYDIEDALRRIDEGDYGACEACGGAIERPRLKALPFAKKCVACQNAAERGRGRHQPFRSGSHLQAQMADEAESAEPSES